MPTSNEPGKAIYGILTSTVPEWEIQSSAADNLWWSVTYGNGLFVAVSINGTGNRVMTSPDGITWTSRTSAADNQWYGVTYGNGLFVAVSITGTGNRVMTSPDGITWTARTSAADNQWYSVTYGNGLFVAVASSGTGNRVMTSPDGINWTARTSAADNQWRSVTYGNGLFVAVASSGTGNRVMTSPDGINWTARTSAADNQWWSVTYGNGLFVAVSITGTGNRVMTLLSETIFKSLINDRIYPNNVPQDVQLPFISYSIVSQEPSITKDVISPLDVIRVSLDIYSTNYDTSNQIASEVRSILDGYKGTINSQVVQRITFDGQSDGEFDSELGVYWQNQDYNMRLKRDRV